MGESHPMGYRRCERCGCSGDSGGERLEGPVRTRLEQQARPAVQLERLLMTLISLRGEFQGLEIDI
jgi:hypothetical protein